jgi:hypothetical protein
MAAITSNAEQESILLVTVTPPIRQVGQVSHEWPPRAAELQSSTDRQRMHQRRSRASQATTTPFTAQTRTRSPRFVTRSLLHDVLVIETIVPEDSARNWERILDMHMLALHGARERTQGEYVALLASAAFRFVHQVDRRAGVSIPAAHSA